MLVFLNVDARLAKTALFEEKNINVDDKFCFDKVV